MPPGEGAQLWAALGAASVLVAAVAAVFLIRPGRRIVVRGSWPALHDQVDMVVNGRAPIAGVRVELAPNGRSLRLMRAGDGFELHLPLPRDEAEARRLETSFRGLCERWCAVPWTQAHPRLGTYVAVALPPSTDVIETRVEQVLDTVLGAGRHSEFRLVILH